MVDESPEVVLARRIIEDGHRDRLAMFNRQVDQDELADLIAAYPEHKEWLLEELKTKIASGGDENDDQQAGAIREVSGVS